VGSISDKFTAELKGCSEEYRGLELSKDALEAHYDQRLADMRVSNDAELLMRASQYRSKIETERRRTKSAGTGGAGGGAKPPPPLNDIGGGARPLRISRSKISFLLRVLRSVPTDGGGGFELAAAEA
jgi:hypothetical protein